jgi:hypothetical protein
VIIRTTRGFGLAMTVSAMLAAPATAAAQSANQEAMMREMQERMTQAAAPGPHHEALARFLGIWDVDIAMVMPSVPATRSKGTAEYTWAIDGRWLMLRIKGEMMGAPMESVSIMGFDNFAKNHVVVSVTSMDTAMNMARGLVVDPTNQVTAVYGTLDEYTTGELHKPYKVVIRRASDTRHVMEIWDLGIGDAGAKVLEYTFTRRR